MSEIDSKFEDYILISFLYGLKFARKIKYGTDWLNLTFADSFGPKYSALMFDLLKLSQNAAFFLHVLDF